MEYKNDFFSFIQAICRHDLEYAVENSHSIPRLSKIVSEDMTLLTMAIEMGDYEMTKLLLENGADINAQCSKGWTALHHAIELAIEQRDQSYDEQGLLRSVDISLIQLLFQYHPNLDIKYYANPSLPGELAIDMVYDWSEFDELVKKERQWQKQNRHF